MKKYIGGLLLLLAGTVFAVSNYLSPSAQYPQSYVINCAPILLLAAILLMGCRRFAALADTEAVIFGGLYGGLLGVLGITVLSMMASRVYPAPYENAAMAIISILACILLLAALIVDFWRNSQRIFDGQIYLRLCVAGVTVLPAMLAALQVMAYFESILSQYVS